MVAYPPVEILDIYLFYLQIVRADLFDETDPGGIPDEVGFNEKKLASV